MTIFPFAAIRPVPGNAERRTIPAARLSGAATKPSSPKAWRLLPCAAFSLCALAACGGGGKDSEAAPTASPPAATSPGGGPAATPTSNIGPDGRPYNSTVQTGAAPPAPADPSANASGTPVSRPPAAAPMPTPPDVTEAATRGAFGATFNWKLIPLHVSLQPDGRVMSYGSDTTGAQNGLQYYAVWDPLLGPAADAITLFDNPTQTDIFCSAGTLLNDGQLLITGGDVTVNYWRNYSTAETNLFDYRSNAMSRAGEMAYKRWYPTLLALPGNQKLVAGGRTTYVNAGVTGNEDKVAIVPELYTPGQGWSPLPGAANMELFGVDYAGNSYLSISSWWYPRIFTAPNGKVFGVSYTGKMYWLTTDGNGTSTLAPGQVAEGSYSFPSIMYRPGKVLSIRNDLKVQTIDFTGDTPVVADTAPIDAVRHHAGATLMADGRVFVHGGSSGDNDGLNEQFQPQIWDPVTGNWTGAARSAQARLYHSTSLLLPDATLLTGGGGAPGPHNNLNAEIYYPSYLFAKDGSGRFATRPTIVGMPTATTWGRTDHVTVNSATPITRVAMVRLGSATHTFDTDQRYVEPAFLQTGTDLAITVPTNRLVAIPGYYMVFAFDADGVPSVAPIVHITD